METTKNNATDRLSIFSMASRKNNVFNYEKIAKNIRKINEMMNLHLSETEMKGIETKVSQFCEAKTKGQSTESKIKKSIRNKMQKVNILIDECKDPKVKAIYESDFKKIAELVY